MYIIHAGPFVIANASFAGTLGANLNDSTQGAGVLF